MGAKIKGAVSVCLLPVYGGGHSFSRTSYQYIKECDLAFTLFLHSELYPVTYTVEVFGKRPRLVRLCGQMTKVLSTYRIQSLGLNGADLSAVHSNIICHAPHELLHLYHIVNFQLC